MTACHENSTELVLNVCDIAISNIDSDSASHTSFVILPVVPSYGSLSTITDILQSVMPNTILWPHNLSLLPLSVRGYVNEKKSKGKLSR